MHRACQLYPYQLETLNWMLLQESGPSRGPDDRACSGGILADDMGLGKTLQTLCVIASAPFEVLRPGCVDALPSGCPTVKGGTLIIAPNAVLEHWRHNVESRFGGRLTAHVYHGTTRRLPEPLPAVVITTYDTARVDAGTLATVHWHRVVLDESQRIKNGMSSGVKAFDAVMTLWSNHRWCLSGTPVETHVKDWLSHFAFLRAQPFCNRSWFKSNFVESRPDQVMRVGVCVQVKRWAGESRC